MKNLKEYQRPREIKTIYCDGDLFYQFKQVLAVENKKVSPVLEEMIAEYIDSRPSIKKLFVK